MFPSNFTPIITLSITQACIGLIALPAAIAWLYIPALRKAAEAIHTLCKYAAITTTVALYIATCIFIINNLI